jgi:hypothetical protein
MRTASTMFSILVLFASVPANAQTVAALQQGARIRVESNDGRGKVGTFLGVSDDSLRFLREGRRSSAIAIPLGAVKNVEVSQGRSPAKGLLIDGLIGTAVGIGVGGILGAATYSKDNSGWCIIACSRGEAAALSAALLGTGGLIVGSIYGAARGREVWESVPMGSR